MIKSRSRTPKTDALLEHQWQILLPFLPRGWQDAAWTMQAMIRRRAITSNRLRHAEAWLGHLLDR